MKILSKLFNFNKNKTLSKKDNPLLKWDKVRRLLSEHVSPSLVEFGFKNPGRTMFRYRENLVEVIDFRCGKWNDRVVVNFGVGLSEHTKSNPKAWDCKFDNQGTDFCSHELLKFCSTEAEQIENFKKFVPLLKSEVESWFNQQTHNKALNKDAATAAPIS